MLIRPCDTQRKERLFLPTPRPGQDLLRIAEFNSAILFSERFFQILSEDRCRKQQESCKQFFHLDNTLIQARQLSIPRNRSDRSDNTINNQASTVT